MNLFCIMIIGCNPEMMDFITHRLWHCVIGVRKNSGVMEVGKDSGVMEVGKDSGHGTWSHLISSHLISWQVEFQPRIA